MLKLLSLTTTLSATLITSIIPQVAFSRPWAETYGYSVVPNSESLVCYMETEEGQTLNLESLCGKVPPGKNANLGIARSALSSSTMSRGSYGVGNGNLRHYPQQTKRSYEGGSHFGENNR